MFVPSHQLHFMYCAFDEGFGGVVAKKLGDFHLYFIHEKAYTTLF